MTKVEQEIEEEEVEEEEVEEQPKKKGKQMFGHDSSDPVDETAKSIFDKIYEVEEEEAEPEDRIETIPMEDDEGRIEFNSEGREKGIVISPYDGSKKYSLIFKNDKGAIVKTITDVRGLYKAKVKFDQGYYSVVVRSKDNNLPFSAKIM